MSINEYEPTRLLFTSLHPSLSSQHLRTHLSQCPPNPPGITDIKVVTRPDGTSRCIAFAGFKSHLEADRVRNWASGAWIAGDRGGSRIKVDWAKDVSISQSLEQAFDLSPNLLPSWLFVQTRDSHPPAKRMRTERSSVVDGTSRSQASDSRFQDFLAVMAPARPSALHDQSEVTPSIVPHFEQPPAADLDPSPSLPAPVSKSPTESLEEEEPPTFANDDAAADDTLTDAEYMAKRMKRTVAELEPVEQLETMDESGGKEWEQEQPAGTTATTDDSVSLEDTPQMIL